MKTCCSRPTAGVAASLFLAGVVLVRSAAAAGGPDPLTLVVLPVKATEKLQDLAAHVTDVLHTRLGAREELSVVEPAGLESVLGEIELGGSEAISPATASRVGRVTGADVLLSGHVVAVQNEIYITVKMIGVRSGNMLGEVVSFPLRGSPAEASERLARRITQTLLERAGELVAAVEEGNADLLETLMLLADGRKLPSVSVSITEHHLGREASERVAQAEVELLLRQLGFPLLDASSVASSGASSGSQAADIEVRGEASSELRLRRGDLVSCRARVEVEAAEPSTGKVVVVDREAAVAVDTVDATAVKEAIAKAASEIAQRVAREILNSCAR